jgi:hypothetical protein
MWWLRAEDTSGGEKQVLRLFRFNYVAQATIGSIDIWCQFHLTKELFFVVSTLMWAVYSLSIILLADCERARAEARQLRKDLKEFRKTGPYGPGY